jgi:hypothetical protein
MNGLLEGLVQNDPESTTLALTSECESADELEALLEALEVNTTIHSVVFRESFFPLRRIRQHLTRHDFRTLLEAVGQKCSQDLSIPATMLGMLRGELAALTMGEHVHNFVANEAITFVSPRDVESMSERLQGCTHLQSLHLGDSYFPRSRPPTMDPLLLAVAGLPHLQHLELSYRPEQQTMLPGDNSSAGVLVTPDALTALLQAPSLHTLNLSRLGLQDKHFQAIAQELPSCSVRQLCLDGNRPSRAGLEVLVESLANKNNNPPQLSSLSLCETWNTDKVDWVRMFPANLHLTELEMDGHRGLDPQVEFWLNMNGMGRATWLLEADLLSSALWPLVLEQISHNASALWYLLQSVPDQIVAS